MVVAVLVYFLLFSGRRIKYNNNGGSGCTTTKISSNGSIDELCVPKRKGYAFVGWFSSNYASNPLMYYSDKYPDLKKAYGYDTNRLYTHWKTFGAKERRNTSEYDINKIYAMPNGTTLYAGWMKK